MVLKITKSEYFLPHFSLPSSKSVSNRALLLNWLSGAPEDYLQQVAECDDTEVLQAALRVLSFQPREEREPVVLDVHGAGTAMRFLCALLSVQHGCFVLTGSARMQQRPIGALVDALRQLGAEIKYLGTEGFPPLKICGKTLMGSKVHLSGEVSSQYVSALMMVGALFPEGLTIVLEGEVVSKPYIEMTMQMMRMYGGEAKWVDGAIIKVERRLYQPTHYCVEADWSAASYWLEMACFLGATPEALMVKMTLSNLQKGLQGDCKVVEMMQDLEENHGKRFEYDFTDTPDLVPTMAVTCALTNTAFVVSGVQNLRYKETNRLLALQQELRKLGVNTEIQDQKKFVWKGSVLQPQGEISYLQPKENTVISTYDDHRMALAFAPACLVLGSICIDDAEVVRKSYPTFWQQLQQCGFKVDEV